MKPAQNENAFGLVEHKLLSSGYEAMQSLSTARQEVARPLLSVKTFRRSSLSAINPQWIYPSTLLRDAFNSALAINVSGRGNAVIDSYFNQTTKGITAFSDIVNAHLVNHYHREAGTIVCPQVDATSLALLKTVGAFSPVSKRGTILISSEPYADRCRSAGGFLSSFFQTIQSTNLSIVRLTIRPPLAPRSYANEDSLVNSYEVFLSVGIVIPSNVAKHVIIDARRTDGVYELTTGFLGNAHEICRGIADSFFAPLTSVPGASRDWRDLSVAVRSRLLRRFNSVVSEL